MTLVAVQCKYNSDERRRTYPQLWHACLVFLGQSLAKWPVSPHFLHSTPSAERGSGQSGLWCPGSVCCQMHSICDLIGRTYVCSYDTRLGRRAHLGNRGHDVPLLSFISMVVVRTQTDHLLDPQRKHLSPTRSTSIFSWGQSRAVWPSSVQNVSKLYEKGL